MRTEALGRELRLLHGRGLAVLGAFAMLAFVFGVLRAAPAGAQAAPTPVRVYVVVLDGLRPSEVNETLMPNLSELRAGGTWYEQARSVFIAETLPNHAAMMTGVGPERNGIVANDFWRPSAGTATKIKAQEPSMLEADTLNTRLEDSCDISTANVLSKEYLWRLFDNEPLTPGDPNPQRAPDYHWDPQTSPVYIPAPDDHAPDVSTMNDGLLPWVRSNAPTPQFVFVNLGDIDRAGHIDELGGITEGGLTASRTAALADADAQLGSLIDELRSSGAWDQTVMMITSDHGFDWSVPQNTIFFSTELSAAGYTTGPDAELWVPPVANGGASIIYLRHESDIAPVARLLDQLEGVDFVATRESIPDLGNPTLHDMGIDHPNAGDIVAYLKPGWRAGDDSNFALPGNHGHPITQHSTLLVTGGSSLLDDTPESVPGELVYDPGVRPFAPPAGGPGNLSIAPTVAALFGIGQPAGGYDGPPLYEAFENYGLVAHAPCQAATPDDLLYPRPASATPLRVPLVPAYAQCTAPDTEHVAPLALPACSATRRESDLVTTSSIGRGSGFVQLRALPGDPLTLGDEADLAIAAHITDVRAGAGSVDYAGRLLLRLGLRITDSANGPPDGAPATVREAELSTPFDCETTAREPLGSQCELTTSADSIVPGLAKEGAGAIMSTPSIEVRDLGADGSIAPETGACPPTCGSGDENVFLREGLFAP